MSDAQGNKDTGNAAGQVQRGVTPRYEIQTTYGYYPAGTWGHAAYRDDFPAAIVLAKELERCRVYDRQSEIVVWPQAE